MKYIAMLLMSLLLVPLSAHAAPQRGEIEFGTYFNFKNLSVYPVADRFRTPNAPLYAAYLSHPVTGVYVIVALSATFGSGTELVAMQHVYMDQNDNLMMGWLPKEKLSPARYKVTIRENNSVLARGSFTIYGKRKKAEDIGPCGACRDLQPFGNTPGREGVDK